MNKALIIDCYDKERTIPGKIKKLFKSLEGYISEKPLIPEFKISNEQFSRQRADSKVSSIQDTISYCSKLSRVKIDRVLYKQILNDRNHHNIFVELEKENPTEKKWYIKHQSGDILGPYDSFEMDKIFQKNQIQEKTKVKTKFDDSYQFFSRIVKRYYKKVIEVKMNLQKDQSKLSKKVSNFKKGQIKTNKNFRLEGFQPKNREERVLSQNIKPNLVFLTDMLPENSEEEDDHYYVRLRANTHQAQQIQN